MVATNPIKVWSFRVLQESWRQNNWRTFDICIVNQIHWYLNFLVPNQFLSDIIWSSNFDNMTQTWFWFVIKVLLYILTSPVLGAPNLNSISLIPSLRIKLQLDNLTITFNQNQKRESTSINHIFQPFSGR